MLPIVAKGAAEEEAAPIGIHARLRAARQGLAAASTKRFVLPGYDETNPELGGAEVIVRYRRLTVEELTEVFKPSRWTSDDGKLDSVAANAQFLEEACDEILFREDGDLTPLVPGAKTTFTVNIETGQSLGTILGIEQLPSLRAQLVAVFGENETTVNDHSREVHQWMVAANRADEASLGEP